jgi:Leucine-rich repeat (LRR) protein
LKLLTKLDLHNNGIKEIAPQLFTELANLKELLLHNNKLKEIPNVYCCSKL